MVSDSDRQGVSDVCELRPEPSGFSVRPHSSVLPGPSRSRLTGCFSPAPSGTGEDDRSGSVGSLDPDDSFASVLSLIREFHDMEEPAGVAPNRCKTSLAPHSQVSSLETLLSSVCEVTSWLDWWLLTCGGFCEHLSGEVRANFERLMLSGLRALEFLGSQDVAALGNLVLSCRDSLLLDVRSTVPAEEVARLRHAPLTSSASLFSPPLLETALVKMCAASNDALVQKTLHPPQIPKKSVPVQSKASSADRGGNTPVVPQSQQSSQSTPSSSSSSRGRSTKGHTGKAPFSQATGRSGGKQKGSRKQ